MSQRVEKEFEKLGLKSTERLKMKSWTRLELMRSRGKNSRTSIKLIINVGMRAHLSISNTSAGNDPVSSNVLLWCLAQSVGLTPNDLFHSTPPTTNIL
ncbi:unnamed protein product [Allacma fusca]|uniref:Uncharacterized protein n=1 Tax=Allacma fusca TaxID=39272 RepID=A0A8J2JML0_9HEXA|nr:unnamed protein product [Allacma fusca]